MLANLGLAGVPNCVVLAANEILGRVFGRACSSSGNDRETALLVCVGRVVVERGQAPMGGHNTSSESRMVRNAGVQVRFKRRRDFRRFDGCDRVEIGGKTGGKPGQTRQVGRKGASDGVKVWTGSDWRRDREKRIPLGWEVCPGRNDKKGTGINDTWDRAA